MKGIRTIVTYNCNIMCSNCRYGCAPYKKGIMEVKDFESKVSEAYNDGYKDYIIIEGGEVFLHTGVLFKYLKKISPLSARKAIVTNGYWGQLDPYMDILLDIKGLGVREIIIEHDYFHSQFISKDIVVSAITKIQKAGLEVSYRSTFLTKDIKSEPDIISFGIIKEIKEKFKKINFILDEINPEKKSLKSISEKSILYDSKSARHRRQEKI